MPCAGIARTRSSRVFVAHLQPCFDEPNKDPERVAGGENPNDMLAANNHRASVLSFDHFGGDLAERPLRRHDVHVDGHGIFHGHLGGIDISQRFHEEEISLRKNADELPAIEDGQVPDPQFPHSLVSRGQRLITPDAVRAAGHEVVNGGSRAFLCLFAGHARW